MKRSRSVEIITTTGEVYYKGRPVIDPNDPLIKEPLIIALRGLSYKVLGRYSRSSSAANAFVKRHQIWRHLFARDFPLQHEYALRGDGLRMNAATKVMLDRMSKNKEDDATYWKRFYEWMIWQERNIAEFVAQPTEVNLVRMLQAYGNGYVAMQFMLNHDGGFEHSNHHVYPAVESYGYDFFLPPIGDPAKDVLFYCRRKWSPALEIGDPDIDVALPDGWEDHIDEGTYMMKCSLVSSKKYPYEIKYSEVPFDMNIVKHGALLEKRVGSIIYLVSRDGEFVVGANTGRHFGGSTFAVRTAAAAKPDFLVSDRLQGSALQPIAGNPLLGSGPAVHMPILRALYMEEMDPESICNTVAALQGEEDSVHVIKYLQSYENFKAEYVERHKRQFKPLVAKWREDLSSNPTYSFYYDFWIYALIRNDTLWDTYQRTLYAIEMNDDAFIKRVLLPAHKEYDSEGYRPYFVAAVKNNNLKLLNTLLDRFRAAGVRQLQDALYAAADQKDDEMVAVLLRHLKSTKLVVEAILAASLQTDNVSTIRYVLARVRNQEEAAQTVTSWAQTEEDQVKRRPKISKWIKASQDQSCTIMNPIFY